MNKSQLETDVIHVIRLLKITSLRQIVMLIRTAITDDEHRVANGRFNEALEVYSKKSRELPRSGRDVQGILKIDPPALLKLWSKVVSCEAKEFVIQQSAHATLVQLQSRLMFAEGYLPLLVKLLTNTRSQQGMDQKKLLDFARPAEWLSLTVQYENNLVAKLSRVGQVMECVETIHQACLQLAQSADNRLEFDFVDSYLNKLRFVGPADNIVALHSLLEALNGVRLVSHFKKKVPIEQQLYDLPIFGVLKRMRHFGSVCPNVLDDTEAVLKLALHKAITLGINPTSRPEKVKVRVTPSLEIATIDAPECPLGTFELSDRNKENGLPLISVDDGCATTQKGLSAHVLHNISRVSKNAEL